MRLSLRNKLAIVFFAITLVSIGALYLYVAPGLQTRLVDEKLSELGDSVDRHTGPIARGVASSAPLRTVEDWVNTAARDSGDRVSLLSVGRAEGRLQLSLE